MAESVEKKPSSAVKYGIQYGVLFAVMSWGMVNTVQATYWQYFMTNVAMISTALVAVIVLVGSIGDIIAVPVAGILMEKIKLPWGKYTSWLLVGPIIVTVFFIFMFIAYPLEESIAAVVFAVAYCLACIGINTMITAQNMAVNLGADNPTERAVLASKKGQGSALAGLVFGVIGLPIIMTVNGGTQDAPMGYIVLIIVLGIIMFASFAFLYVNITKKLKNNTAAGPIESDMSKEDAKKIADQEDANKLSAGDMVKAVFTNIPLVAIILGDGARYIGRATMMGLLAYYFKYVIGDPSGVAMFLGMSGIVALIGAVVTEVLVHKFQKRTMYLLGMGIMIACYAAMYFFGTTVQGFVAIGAVWYIGLAFVNSTQVGLYADAVDHGVWKMKKNCRAWLTSIAGYPPKMGNIGKAFIVGFGLAFIGFDAAGEITPAIIEGMRTLMCVLPAGIFVIGFLLVFLGYKLSNDKMIQIQADLKEWGLSNK